VPARNRNAIAAQTAQPCRRDPVIDPSVYVRPDEIAKMPNIARKLLSGVGFSNGCALLALKNPPPLVPNCLMISWDATGPCAIVCSRTTVDCGFPSTVVMTVCGSTTAALSYGRKFWTTPCETRNSDPTIAIGSSTHSDARTMSTQKLPIVSCSFCAMPRMNAIATAMPTAADTKLWYASPAIWVK
jgi:hypothetical protein